MLQEVTSKKFKKDVKKLNKQRKDLTKLAEPLDKIKNGQPLDAKYEDHPLEGNKAGCRDCHIEPDWVLIYRVNIKEGKLYLLRTGSHSEVFKESFSSDLTISQINEKLNKFLEDI